MGTETTVPGSGQFTVRIRLLPLLGGFVVIRSALSRPVGLTIKPFRFSLQNNKDKSNFVNQEEDHDRRTPETGPYRCGVIHA